MTWINRKKAKERQHKSIRGHNTDTHKHTCSNLVKTSVDKADGGDS